MAWSCVKRLEVRPVAVLGLSRAGQIRDVTWVKRVWPEAVEWPRLVRVLPEREGYVLGPIVCVCRLPSGQNPGSA